MVVLRRLALVMLALLGLTALTPIASGITGGGTALISPAYADDDDDDDDDGIRRRRDRAVAGQRPGRNVQHNRSYRGDDDDDRVRGKWRRSRDDDDDDDRDDD